MIYFAQFIFPKKMDKMEYFEKDLFKNLQFKLSENSFHHKIKF
jgi:hypothetical protein